MSKLSKKQVIDYVFHNYGLLCSRLKLKFIKLLINLPKNKIYPTLTPEPTKISKIDVKKDAASHYKPEKINDAFNDKYIEY